MTMAEESADAVEIDAGFEEVRGEGVAKTVDAALGGDARGVARRLALPLPHNKCWTFQGGPAILTGWKNNIRLNER